MRVSRLKRLSCVNACDEEEEDAEELEEDEVEELGCCCTGCISCGEDRSFRDCTSCELSMRDEDIGRLTPYASRSSSVSR